MSGIEEERQVYRCTVCNGTKFGQIVKDEYDKIYDSVEHVVTKHSTSGIGSEWRCVRCSEPIPLKLLVHIFSAVKLEGFE